MIHLERGDGFSLLSHHRPSLRSCVAIEGTRIIRDINDGSSRWRQGVTCRE